MRPRESNRGQEKLHEVEAASPTIRETERGPERVPEANGDCTRIRETKPGQGRVPEAKEIHMDVEFAKASST